MARDFLKDVSDSYDVIVIGSGLGGLTAANCLAKQGHSVLVLEHHYHFGGLATWFTRKRGHIFDISLHGFPIGMIKSCKKYWTPEIADSIVQLKDVRFVNPQFNIQTTFDRTDFTRILVDEFKIPIKTVEAFYDHLRQMNFYDQDTRTTQMLFDEFFPNNTAVQRLLMEPIAYANGSTLQDPAISYGIVFSNFMSKGVYTFQGGTDVLIKKMVQELQNNGVDIRSRCLVERIKVESLNADQSQVTGVWVNGRFIAAKTVISNANLKTTLFHLIGEDKLPKAYAAQAQAVRTNHSSCQVYMGIRAGDSIPHIGDLIFTSDVKDFSSQELSDFHTQSRTFSIYYPETRPHLPEPRYAIVASLNGKWADWNSLSEIDYQAAKARLCEESLTSLEQFIPDIRSKIDWIEAATPKTIHRYTQHHHGTSFGTKFEGLKVSFDLPDTILGLYHTGSVGIIMSGWLGTMNYGVITANKVDRYLHALNQ